MASSHPWRARRLERAPAAALWTREQLRTGEIGICSRSKGDCEVLELLDDRLFERARFDHEPRHVRQAEEGHGEQPRVGGMKRLKSHNWTIGTNWRRIREFLNNIRVGVEEERQVAPHHDELLRGDLETITGCRCQHWEEH